MRLYDPNLDGITKERKTVNTFLILKRDTVNKEQLKMNDNDLVYTDKEILNECVSFIKVFTAPKRILTTQTVQLTGVFFTQQQKGKCLNKDEKLLCEGLVN